MNYLFKYKRTMNPDLERRFVSDVLRPEQILPRRAFHVERGCYSRNVIDLYTHNKKNALDVASTCREDVCNSPENDGSYICNNAFINTDIR